MANSNQIRLEKVRGKFIHHMGYLADSVDDESKSTKVDFLYPEEALFLTENVTYMVYIAIKKVYNNRMFNLFQVKSNCLFEYSRNPTTLNEYSTVLRGYVRC